MKYISIQNINIYKHYIIYNSQLLSVLTNIFFYHKTQLQDINHIFLALDPSNDNLIMLNKIMPTYWV